jgi:hypothetical protein
MTDHDEQKAKELVEEFERLASELNQAPPGGAAAEISAARMNRVITQLQTKRSGLLMRAYLASMRALTNRAGRLTADRRARAMVAKTEGEAHVRNAMESVNVLQRLIKAGDLAPEKLRYAADAVERDVRAMSLFLAGMIDALERQKGKRWW